MRWCAAVVWAAAALPAQDLDQLVQQATALGAVTGIAVRDLEPGPMLYRHRADTGLVPASNLKLVTAAGVLHGLGAAHEFSTRVWLRGGRLQISAGGDPNWITGTEYAPERFVAAIADALQRGEVHAVAGIDLLAGTFIGPERPAGWPADQIDTYYCAPTSCLPLEQGTFQLRIASGNGQANVELVAPPMVLPFKGAIAMTARKRDAAYGAIDLDGSIKLSGRFAAGTPPVQIRTAQRAPATWAAMYLQQALRTRGIAVDPEAAPADRDLLDWRTPLAPAIGRMLRDSSNFDAEQCTRVLGAAAGDGSLAGGLAALQREVGKMAGRLPEGVQIIDGSGLSRDNRVTAAFLVEVVRAALRGPNTTVFLDGLPQGGESGTLEDRFRASDLGPRVRAKTGWIRGASALSGVVQRSDGGWRAFAILMNYDARKNGLNRDLKQIQEHIVAALLRLPARRDGL